MAGGGAARGRLRARPAAGLVLEHGEHQDFSTEMLLLSNSRVVGLLCMAGLCLGLGEHVNVSTEMLLLYSLPYPMRGCGPAVYSIIGLVLSICVIALMPGLINCCNH